MQYVAIIVLISCSKIQNQIILVLVVVTFFMMFPHIWIMIEQNNRLWFEGRNKRAKKKKKEWKKKKKRETPSTLTRRI